MGLTKIIYEVRSSIQRESRKEKIYEFPKGRSQLTAVQCFVNLNCYTNQVNRTKRAAP